VRTVSHVRSELKYEKIGGKRRPRGLRCSRQKCRTVTRDENSHSTAERRASRETRSQNAERTLLKNIRGHVAAFRSIMMRGPLLRQIVQITNTRPFCLIFPSRTWLPFSSLCGCPLPVRPPTPHFKHRVADLWSFCLWLSVGSSCQYLPSYSFGHRKPEQRT
jgi:hypothetical protein